MVQPILNPIGAKIAPAKNETSKTTVTGDSSNQKKVEAVKIVNDLTAELKAKVITRIGEDAKKILESSTLSINDLAKVLLLTHGAVKSRVSRGQKISEVVLGVINATPKTPKKVSVEQLGTLLANLSKDEREKILTDLKNASK